MKSHNVEDIYELSPLQQGILLHARTTPGTALYFVQWLCLLHGDLNIPAFQQAWQLVVDRHPSLRTIYLWEGLEMPLQVVRKQARLPWEVLDWQDVDAQQQQQQLDEYLRADQQRGFDFKHAPLMRLTLIRTSPSDHQLIWSFHHLLVDGWSILLLLQEVLTLYRQLSQQQPINLVPARPYRDYIAWLQKQDLTKAEAYWRAKLAGFETPTPLPFDRVNPSNNSLAQYVDHYLTLPSELTASLQQFAREQQLTLNTLAQAAWALVLHRHSGQDDIVFGATVAGRPTELPGVEELVGLCINTLPVRVRFTPEMMLLPWLHQIQNEQIAARQYEHSPLVHVQRWSAVEPGQPLFQSLLSFENYPGGAFALDTGLDTLHISHPRAIERVSYPLNLSVTLGSELSLKFIYDARQFDARTISQLAEHVQLILEQFVGAADQRVADLAVLTAAEQQQLATWNATARDVTPTCLHHMFEQHAERTPDATALVFGQQQMSYGELERRANQLAHYLQQHGVGPDSLVGLSTERSFEMLIGILGILKAGSAFVPLDPTYPRDRLAFMAEDAQLRLLLTTEHLLPTWQQTADIERVVCLDRDWPMIATQPTERPNSAVGVGNLAYVIYTSGSTGKPKGVLVEHTGIANLVAAQIEQIGVSAQDRVLQFAAFSFDASVFEIAMALGTGATLCLATREDLLPGPALLQLLERQAISVLTIVPSALAVVPHAALPALKRIIVAGEPCPADLVMRWAPGRHFFNAYGPTETTVWATLKECEANGQAPSIGGAILNTQIHILDSWQRPVPIGRPGEIYIGGVGLARGYLGRPELTAERFITHPTLGRLYRTGDLARHLPDGQIEFLGRIDQQVKLRGFRIELGEIEAALRQHPSLRDAAALVREDTPGDARLVAYVVPQEHAAAQSDQFHEELRNHLRGQLPNYMVPTHFVTLNALPLMSNGKLDRRALPAPTQQPVTTNNALLMPQNSIEQTIAAIWRKALRIEHIGRHDNFFDLGGHSLLMGQIHGALQEQFAQPIALIDLFSYPTVSALAQFLGQHAQPSAPAQEEREREEQARAGRNRLRQLQSRRERL